MSLLYRTIFSLPRPNLVDDVTRSFETWIRSKGIDADIPSDGTRQAGDVEIATAHATEGDLDTIRLALHEERAGERWSTTVTAIADGPDRCVWVDLERVTEDPYGRPPLVAVPRIVSDLLSQGDAHAGTTTLPVEPTVVDEHTVDGLVAQLTDSARIIPIVIVSKDRYASPDGTFERGQQLLRRILGLAPVFLLEGLATSALSQALGSDLHVFGGAVRTYLPDLTIPDRAPKRHPYIAGRIFSSQPSAAATRIQRSLVQQAVALRPPQVYRERVITLPGFPRYQGGSKDEELLELIEVEQERDQLTREMTELRDEMEFATLQLDETEAELDRAHARVRYLEERLRAAGDAAANEPTPSAAIPETAESCAEAIGLARQYLSNLEIGDTDYFTAALDTYIKSPVWARKSWRAFRALHDYAQAKVSGTFAGDFLAYCTEGPLGTAAIPTSWVAMKESESTDNNPRYREARVFPVPAEVADDELVYMCAHIKIESGGRPAPRIHFHDDTSGTTGLIYVGYFGEHLPNDRTN